MSSGKSSHIVSKIKAFVFTIRKDFRHWAFLVVRDTYLENHCSEIQSEYPATYHPLSQLHIIIVFPSIFTEKFQVCLYQIWCHLRQLFSVLPAVSISKNAFLLLDEFSFFFIFPSNNITEKWCEIDPSVSSFTLRHAHTNQRVCMKCRRQRKLKKNRHMLFLLLQWMKTEGPEVPESYKTCKAGMLLPRTCCHLWLLALPWPQESLETGIHHWGFEKAALGYWATGFMKLSLLSYLWCLSAL